MNEDNNQKKLTLDNVAHDCIATLSKMDMEVLKDLQQQAWEASKKYREAGENFEFYRMRSKLSMLDFAINWKLYERSKNDGINN